MPVFIYDLLFLAAAAAGGTTAGYWIRSCRRESQHHDFTANSTAESESIPGEETARESLYRVKELAERVAADVGEHNTQVRLISDELAERDCDVVAAVARLIEANERMQLQLSSAERRLQEQAELLETHANAARTDALTGLANRRAFDAHMHDLLTRFETEGETSSVMMLDVDHFKKFNDTYGHLAGDEVLKGVGRILQEHASSGEIAARYGGEEFALIFPRTSAARARVAAERARAAIGEAEFAFEGTSFKVTASAGLAELLEGESVEMLIQRGDEALYASKKAGRNCGHWHNGEGFVPLLSQHTHGAETFADGSPEAAPALNKASDTLRDPVTGLSSLHVFSDDVTRRLAEHRRSGSPLALILVRIDNFHKILEHKGDDKGSVLLRVTTRFLKAASRAMDHVARYGDDTFAVLLPGAQLADAVKIADRLRAAVAQFSFMLGGEPFQFTVSIGVGEARAQDEAPAMLDRVQKALSTATNRRGNQVVFHDGGKLQSSQTQSAV